MSVVYKHFFVTLYRFCTKKHYAYISVELAHSCYGMDSKIESRLFAARLPHLADVAVFEN